MTWTYEQTSGRLFDPDGNFKAKGYAGGNCGKNPEGVNNHEMQNCRAIGPLPVGLYSIGNLIEKHAHLGPFVMPLSPDTGNEMFERSGFFIHGDTSEPFSASEGCIILPRDVRLAIAQSPDRRLQVVARVENGEVA